MPSSVVTLPAPNSRNRSTTACTSTSGAEAPAETPTPSDGTNGAEPETKAGNEETPSKVVPFVVPEGTRSAEAQS